MAVHASFSVQTGHSARSSRAVRRGQLDGFVGFDVRRDEKLRARVVRVVHDVLVPCCMFPLALYDRLDCGYVRSKDISPYLFN